MRVHLLSQSQSITALFASHSHTHSLSLPRNLFAVGAARNGREGRAGGSVLGGGNNKCDVTGPLSQKPNAVAARPDQNPHPQAPGKIADTAWPAKQEQAT